MKNKRNKIVVSILISVILLISLSYAYFVSRVIGNAGNVTIATDNLTLTFTDTNSFASKLSNSSLTAESKVFTLENSATNKNISFSLVWETLTNNFINKSYLKYSITPNDSVNCPSLLETQMPSGGKNITIIDSGVITANTTCTFTMKVWYEESENYNQNNDQNKSFIGKLNIKTTPYTEEINYVEPNVDYSINTLGKAIIDNNTLYSSSPTLEKLSISSEMYNSLISSATSEELELYERIYITNENGLYKVEGNNGLYSYVLRGTVNNKVRFAGFIWKIIRINEDGSIRLALANDFSELTEDDISYMTSNEKSINESDYEVEYNINKLNKVCYQNCKYDKNSTVKDFVDNFYNIHLLKYKNKIVYSTFCDSGESFNFSFVNYLDYIADADGFDSFPSLATAIINEYNESPEGITNPKVLPLESDYETEFDYYYALQETIEYDMGGYHEMEFLFSNYDTFLDYANNLTNRVTNGSYTSVIDYNNSGTAEHSLVLSDYPSMEAFVHDFAYKNLGYEVEYDSSYYLDTDSYLSKIKEEFHSEFFGDYNFFIRNYTLKCNTNQVFTSRAALISAHEIVFSGGYYLKSLDEALGTDTFLKDYIGFTLSGVLTTPFLLFNGYIYSHSIYSVDEKLVSPIISISLSKSVIVTSGDGSENTPYIIN